MVLKSGWLNLRRATIQQSFVSWFQGGKSNAVGESSRISNSHKEVRQIICLIYLQAIIKQALKMPKPLLCSWCKILLLKNIPFWYYAILFAVASAFFFFFFFFFFFDVGFFFVFYFLFFFSVVFFLSCFVFFFFLKNLLFLFLAFFFFFSSGFFFFFFFFFHWSDFCSYCKFCGYADSFLVLRCLTFSLQF